MYRFYFINGKFEFELFKSIYYYLSKLICGFVKSSVKIARLFWFLVLSNIISIAMFCENNVINLKINQIFINVLKPV